MRKKVDNFSKNKRKIIIKKKKILQKITRENGK